MTGKRRVILDIFQKGDHPLSATQIYSNCPLPLDKATVYRALTWLSKEGYLSSFLFECTERGIERYYNLRSDDHRHHLHCSNCHRFVPLSQCPLKGSLKGIEEEMGVSIEEHSLTLRGLCNDCLSRRNA